ncbi:tetratricopeptide repeat protein [Colwelliaceae bacterium 6471]
MKASIYALFVLMFFLLGACQSTQHQATTSTDIVTNLYLDELFPNNENIVIESEQEIFALDDEMREMVITKLRSEKDTKERALKLIKHIFETENIGVAYASNANVTAREAYHSKSANCMSLTIMAYALAKEANFDIQFQNVKIPEYWVRNGTYNMLTGHVNLKITQSKSPNELILWSKALEIDFDPFVAKKSFPKQVINKKTVLAMFYNNKGAQALIKKQYDIAYKYLKTATHTDPHYDAAWGNLGILYRFLGRDDYAKKSYQHAMALDKSNLTAMTNLSFLLKREGNVKEANRLEKLLHEKRIANPYYHALLADEAFYNGENKEAIKHYRKAIKLNNKIHEFYFGIAKAYYKLDDIKAAKRALLKAIAINRVPFTDSQYVAKLNFLKNEEVTH